LTKIDLGQFDAAEEQNLQGISELDEQGVLSFLSIGHLWLEEVYAESGRKKNALMHLKKAATMFREMGMNSWLAKKLRKSY
jgi:hypothetical protein